MITPGASEIRQAKARALARRRAKRRAEGVVLGLAGGLLRSLPGSRRPVPRKVSKVLLVLRGQRLGDAVVSLAFSAALRRRHPEAEIWAAAPPQLAELLACDHNLDRFFALPWPERHSPVRAASAWRELRAQGFDLAYPLGIQLMNAVMARACAAYSVGYDYNGRGRVLDEPRRPHLSCNRSGWEYGADSDPPHVVDFWGMLLKRPGEPAPPVSWRGLDLAVHRPAARRWLESRGLAAERPLILHPWAGNPIRTWPLSHARRFLELWLRDRPEPVVLTGGAADRAAGERLAQGLGPRVLSAAGDLSPGQTWALLEPARLVVSVDTCVIHMAAALPRPVVSLFGAGDPLVWGPYGQADGVVQEHRICQRCKRASCLFGSPLCMGAISPEVVMERALAKLGAPGGAMGI